MVLLVKHNTVILFTEVFVAVFGMIVCWLCFSVAIVIGIFYFQSRRIIMDRPEYLYYRGCAKLKLAHIIDTDLIFYMILLFYILLTIMLIIPMLGGFFFQSDNVDTKHVFLIFFL